MGVNKNLSLYTRPFLKKQLPISFRSNQQDLLRGDDMQPSLYGDYCKPKLQELIAALKLDQHYVKAGGDYLQTEDGTKVLDFVGGVRRHHSGT